MGQGSKIIGNRREFVAGFGLSLLSFPAVAQPGLIFRFDSPLYRGFTIQSTRIENAPRRQEILASVRQQIDMALDCGAAQSVLNFFTAQEITIRPSGGNGGGEFFPARKGVTLDAEVFSPQNPVLLHELLDAYHDKVLPGGFRNPDVLGFYNAAKNGQHYKPDADMLKNPREFFAVTASLYLAGHVNGPPGTRQNLKNAQPAYYAWLGKQFGVEK